MDFKWNISHIFVKFFCRIYVTFDEINRPNKLCSDSKRIDFGTNKTPVDVIKKGAFDRNFFRDIYSIVNNKLHKNSWKEFNELKRSKMLMADLMIILFHLQLETFY